MSVSESAENASENLLDYYPFGKPLPGRQYISSITNKRRGYQGYFSELDEETGWNNFYFRDYDAEVGRFLTFDPYNEFHSPYLGMGNNPISFYDPTGGYIGEKTVLAVRNFFKKTFTGRTVGSTKALSKSGGKLHNNLRGKPVHFKGGLAKAPKPKVSFVPVELISLATFRPVRNLDPTPSDRDLRDRTPVPRTRTPGWKFYNVEKGTDYSTGRDWTTYFKNNNIEKSRVLYYGNPPQEAGLKGYRKVNKPYGTKFDANRHHFQVIVLP